MFISPFAGVIAAKSVEPGSWLSPALLYSLLNARAHIVSKRRWRNRGSRRFGLDSPCR